MKHRPSLEDIFEWVYDDGDWCYECSYYECRIEHHGDRSQPGERLCECTAKGPNDCPGVESVLDQLTREYHQTEEPCKRKE